MRWEKGEIDVWVCLHERPWKSKRLISVMCPLNDNVNTQKPYDIKCFNCFMSLFFQILRNHVMVRVGGGWDTLEHYLDKHDPCRCQGEKLL